VAHWISHNISWKTFRNFWGRNYSKLILPNARHDICGECFILANAFFRYRKHTTTRADATDDDADGDGDGNDDGNADDGLAEEQDPNFEARELALENANKHCNTSICQRKLANEKIAKAKEDKMNNVSHSS
jgi:hypothetical protein